MRISHLKLHNYRCFEDFEMEFKDSYIDELSQEAKPINLHVLLAPNMVGKSAILKSIRIAIAARFRKIGANIGAIDNFLITPNGHRLIHASSGGQGMPLFGEEVTIEANVISYEWDKKNWTENIYAWKKYKTSRKSKEQYIAIENDISKAAFASYNRCIEKQEGLLPLLLFVGTEYIHQPKPETNTLNADGTPQQGYWYCLDNKSMENYVFKWFEKMKGVVDEQAKNQTLNKYFGDVPHLVLDTFRSTLQQLLPDIKDVAWTPPFNSNNKNKKYELVFDIENEGSRTYDMLSDGYRYLVLLVGEMVTRAILLNRHLGDKVLQHIRGIVLIDEFGIHLHPQIQSDVLNRLAAIFPKVQFIVTTHSPLLINGLRKEQIHLIYSEDNQRKEKHPDMDAIGLGAEGILLELFGLHTTYDKVVMGYKEEYAVLFNKRLNRTLSTEEQERFAFLQKRLSQYRFDDSLVFNDPIVKMVEERLRIEVQNQAEPPKETLKNRVNAILDDLLKPKNSGSLNLP